MNGGFVSGLHQHGRWIREQPEQAEVNVMTDEIVSTVGLFKM